MVASPQKTQYYHQRRDPSNSSREAGLAVCNAAAVSGAETETLPEIEIGEDTDEEEAIAPPWNVIVHNDPVNLMSYVTMVFKRIFGYSTDRARKHMLEVHHQGRSIVWSGHREKAEFYVEQLHGYQLLATLEPSE